MSRAAPSVMPARAASAPIRARRAEYAADFGALDAVLAAGNRRANTLADQTLAAVHAAMGTGGLPTGRAG